jgi:Domain of unknown function(DUF2779)
MTEAKTKTPRYLTKSRYKQAIDCPAKLYYTDKEKEYANQMDEDPFMEALAVGGFQIGALAKLYCPEGVEVFTRDYDESVAQTNELLKQKNVTIFEAAIRFENYFIRVDILKKRGDHVDLIEVKAKSIEKGESFLKVKKSDPGIYSGWLPYLKDIAYQRYVLAKAFPQYDITAFLMMADKSAICPTDRLNQKFKIVKDKNENKSIKINGTITDADLSQELLIAVPVNDCCQIIYDGKDAKEQRTDSYEKELKWYADNYAKDEKIDWMPCAACKKCEFKTIPADKAKGLKSGFEECWKKMLKFTEKDLAEPTVLEGWYFPVDDLINDGIARMKNVTERYFKVVPDKKLGLSRGQRQWLQVEKVKSGDRSVWVDKKDLKAEMDKFVFPLHFIDFETTMTAIPFYKGMHPYEGIAFQFSHHITYEDGRVEHKGEYLNTEPGAFPNFDFVRELKKQLETDKGSIFRYSNHENTYLNMIKAQLKDVKSDIADRDDLISFMNSITEPSKDDAKAGVKWENPRKMLDLWDMVKRYYYDPYTHGSNSIKYVLPAVLNSSQYLKGKYSKPIYGAKGGIPSKNFKDKQWLVIENGKVVEPYKQLPKLFKEFNEGVELMSDSDEIKNGGAALTAYGKLQFEEMSDEERKEINAGLLRYCELDTLAMVMIYECWRELLKG